MQTRVISRFIDDTDPITNALAPPPNETPAARAARLLSEKQAKQVSDSIDEELIQQRIAEKKAPKALKILLLGQSESGKSTTLKNFQLMYTPKAFRAERASWRAVIQLNVVRSIHLILDAMTEDQANYPPNIPSPSSSPPSSSSGILSSRKCPQLTAEHLKLKLRLAPLLQVEEVLTQRLTPSGSGEYEPTQLIPATNNLPYSERAMRRIVKEVTVNSTTPWKCAFNRLVNMKSSFDSAEVIDWDDPNDPGVVLHACCEDMIRLWNDPIIKELLEAKNLRLQEMAGFFLDSLDRVAAQKYLPSDDDILRARLKTLGVSEYRFKIDSGNSLGSDWRIFDVGGQRSLRGMESDQFDVRGYPINITNTTTAAWAPYFDDIDAIIFLAPISCFDQALAEDHRVNRLEDSVNLWSSIVSNQLLENTNLVLFLNKCDILKQKLSSGIKLSKYVVSYADRPNDFENASTYLRKKFGAILKDQSPVKRVFYCHFTSVTDTKSTTYILSNLKDMLMRQNLQKSNLM